MEFKLTPLTVLLRSLLDQLQEKDPARIFAHPVNLSEVPDYLDHIKHPMDFSTMKKRLEDQRYRNINDFEEEFNLIIENCMKYNAKDTIFYRAAVRLRDHGGVLLRQARREANAIGFDDETGMHLTEQPKIEPPPQFSWEDVDKLLNPNNRVHMPLEEQLKELLEKLDITFAMKSSASRSKRLKLLKKEIANIRQMLSQQHVQPPQIESGIGSFEEESGSVMENDGEEEGLSNGYGEGNKEKEFHVTPGRKVEPRRRCASESSISSNNSLLCNSSFSLPKCGKGKPALIRRHTIEDRNELISCIENGNYAKAARIAAEVGQTNMWVSASSTASFLEPLKVVWAKCSGYPSYPALIIDPKMPRVGCHHNGVAIPVPPMDVLKTGEQMQTRAEEKLFLVLFFDNKRSWQWLPKSKMVPLGIDETIDKLKMMEGRNSSIRKAVRVAYDRAVNHLSRVQGESVSDFSDID
ncbi:hypothetical protein GDO86_005879 [Hymenochirus boettgeri]|uniref:Bromodomain containing 1 n=1 Tax=Hymenochirus boettgeri TaxID=247094 RepID=A0A8T2J8H1_9PIPI|nr:hypothetical protein GDO86_005879 [Hymenochirus boettgeri]